MLLEYAFPGEETLCLNRCKIDIPVILPFFRLLVTYGNCYCCPKYCCVVYNLKNYQLWRGGRKTSISRGDHVGYIPLTACSEVWVFIYDTASARNRCFRRSERRGRIGRGFLLQGPKGVKCDCQIDGGSIRDGLCHSTQENKVRRRWRTCHAPQLFQVSTGP